MDRITNVQLVPLNESRFVVPFRMEFMENETKKFWDLVQVHPSVTVIIYNVSRRVLVCVKQFRPGVYLNKIPQNDRKTVDCMKYPREIGLTLEWCSGIVDKDKSLEEIACDEMLEECGYSFKPEMLERVQSFRCSVGICGDNMTMFFAQVTDEMKTAKGGGLIEEGEIIDIVELPVSEALDILKKPDVDSPADFLYGLMWFQINKLSNKS